MTGLLLYGAGVLTGVLGVIVTVVAIALRIGIKPFTR